MTSNIKWLRHEHSLYVIFTIKSVDCLFSLVLIFSLYQNHKQKYVHDEIVTLKLKDINAEHYSILSPNVPKSKDYTVFLHLRDNEGCTTSNASTHILGIQIYLICLLWIKFKKSI